MKKQTTFLWPSLLRVPAKFSRIMKLIVICFLAFMQVSAAGYSQKISLKMKHASLNTVLKAIENQSDYVFLSKDVDLSGTRVGLNVKNASIEETLAACFSSLPISYSMVNKTIFIAKNNEVTVSKVSAPVFANEALFVQEVIRGKVTDASGEALQGAVVQVIGEAGGTTTNEEGEFSLSVEKSTGTLLVRYIGYENQNIALDGRSEYRISLVQELASLSDVVVTALGIKREQKSLGYSTQTVSGENINTVKSDNFVNALSGKVAGIQIKRSSNLGGSSNVIIRGNKSLTGNNQALYVVDGVPINDNNINTDNQQVGQPGFDYGNAASDINPDDIASISVLKGAAATALYGSRAANGVIMITTKDGSGTPGFSVVVNSGVNLGRIDKSTFPTYQNEYGAGYGPYYASSDQYFYLEDVDGDGVNDLVAPYREDASYGGKFDPSLSVYQWDSFDSESPNYLKATPWVAAKNGPISFFENPVTFNNSVSLSGSKNKDSYRISYTNLDQGGLMPNSKLKRNNLALNSKFALTSKLNASASLNYIKTDARGRNNTGYGSNIVNTLRQWWQTNVDLKEQEAIYLKTKRNVTWNPASSLAGSKPLYTDNPYWQVYENFTEDSRERFIASTSLDYTITDWLSILGRVSVDSYKSKDETRIAVGSGRPGEYTLRNGSFSEYNADLMGRVNKQISDDFNLSGVLGFNSRRTNLNSVFATTNGGLIVPGLYSLSNSKNPMGAPEEALSKIGVDGYYASASVGYRNFLYMDLTGRSDISSTLPKGDNRYFYPSISSSFIFSEFIDADWLTLGKLRLGYAEVGNDAPFASLYDTYKKPDPFGSIPIFTMDDTKKNDALKPEKTKSLETGLEMVFFKNRLSFDLSLYKTNTVNQIMPVAVTEASGFSNRFVNAGEIENKGIEFALRGKPVTNDNFEWNVNLNFAKNRNKVLSLYDNIENIQLGFFNGGGVSFNASIGEPFGVLKGKDFLYLNGQRVVNADDGLYEITEGSDQVIGNMNPDWNAGINNQFSYKNVSLSFLLDIQKGGSVFSADRWYGSSSGIYAESAGLNDQGVPLRDPVANGGGTVLAGVFPDGSQNDIRVQMTDSQNALSYASGRMPQSAFVYDASYVKLRELVVSYTLPKRFLGTLPVNSVAVSFVGSNLWILHKNTPYSDPEAGISAGNIQGYQTGVLPTTRNFGFNLKVQF